MLQCTGGPVVPCGGVRVFLPDPAALASLLGSNYQLLFLSFQGGLLHSLPVTGFTPGELKFGLLILVCCTFLPHPSSQDRVSGDFALSAIVLKVEFCLRPLSALFCSGCACLFTRQLGVPVTFWCMMDGTKRSKRSLISLIARIFANSKLKERTVVSNC